MSEQPENVRTKTMDFLCASMPDRSRRDLAIWLAGLCGALGSAPVRAAIAEVQLSGEAGEIYDVAILIETLARARAYQPAGRRTAIQSINTNGYESRP